VKRIRIKITIRRGGNRKGHPILFARNLIDRHVHGCGTGSGLDPGLPARVFWRRIQPLTGLNSIFNFLPRVGAMPYRNSGIDLAN